MKTNLALHVLTTIFAFAHYSCNSSGNPSFYEPKEEQKTVLFDGNFKGNANGSNITISIKNNNGQVNGTYTNPGANFTLAGSIDANNILNARLDNGVLNLECKGYYQGYNLVLELDEDFVNLVRIAALFDGDGTLAGQLESKIVLQKQ